MSNCVAHPYGELYTTLLAQKRKKRAIYYQIKRLKLRKYARKVDALVVLLISRSHSIGNESNSNVLSTLR